MYNRLFGFLLLPFSLYGYDDIHFYRATFLFPEPRLERPWLTTIDFSMSTGSTVTARNNQGDKVPLLELYNPRLTSLTEEKSDVIDTKFSFFQATLIGIQNFNHGLFSTLYLPIKRLKIKNSISRPSSSQERNESTILHAQNQLNQPRVKTGISDIVWYIGWTHNYQETEELDFIDVCAKTGILLPTAPSLNVFDFFPIPLGYGGHFGIPLHADLSIGAFEWLTVGIHNHLLWLFNRTKHITFKTIQQSLVRGDAHIKKGLLWHLGGFAKADHVIRGLSLTIGYSFAQKNKDSVTPLTKSLLVEITRKKDGPFKSWNMHTFHFSAEYDLSKECQLIGPRIGFHYNKVLTGKRIFTTPSIGGSLSLDLAWKF